MFVPVCQTCVFVCRQRPLQNTSFFQASRSMICLDVSYKVLGPTEVKKAHTGRTMTSHIWAYMFVQMCQTFVFGCRPGPLRNTNFFHAHSPTLYKDELYQVW